MSTERKNWRIFLAAAVVGMGTMGGCAPEAFGQEKQGDGKTTFEIRPTETLKIYELLWPPIPTVTPSVTPTESSTPTPTLTETPLPAQTATETSTATATATRTGTPTIPPSFLATIRPVEKETSVRYLINWGDRTRPEVALTFDDGFDKKSVENVLDILKKYNVKATFFVIGKQLFDKPELWKRAVAEGQQICNHTHSHAWLTNLTDEGIKAEIEDWEKDARKVLGDKYVDEMKKNYPYIRFPGGEGNGTLRILKVATDCGYQTIGSSKDTYYDVLRKSDLKDLGKGNIDKVSSQIVEDVVSNVKNGQIVSQHFGIWDTAKLEDEIKGLTVQGFKIVTVSRVLE